MAAEEQKGLDVGDDGVLEIAQVDVRPGTEADFAQNERDGRELIAATVGFRSMRVVRGIETPSRFVLLVEWDSVEAHAVFRNSERFDVWRHLIAPYMAGAPAVEHYRDS